MIRISIFITLLPLLLTSCMKNTKTDSKYKTGVLKENYQLAWSETFQEEELDSGKWNIEIREPGWVNNELQAYTDRKDNLLIKDGNLIIRGIKENYGKAKYTSGRINTSQKINWKYGRFEIRAKIPKQKGVWPAIWLLSESISKEGWPKCGEIDIMEHINKEDIIYGTIHSEEYNHMTETQIGGNVTIDSLDTKFHTFGLEWNSESIVWFIDDNIYHRVNKKDYFDDQWPFDNDYFLIINQAIGGFWPGDPEEDFKTTEYIIDWIKIYQ